MYLKHIEHSPENLEFYVWFKNYEAGRLTGTRSRPNSKDSGSNTLDFGYSRHASMTASDEKSFNNSDSDGVASPNHSTSLPRLLTTFISC